MLRRGPALAGDLTAPDRGRAPADRRRAPGGPARACRRRPRIVARPAPPVRLLIGRPRAAAAGLPGRPVRPARDRRACGPAPTGARWSWPTSTTCSTGATCSSGSTRRRASTRPGCSTSSPSTCSAPPPGAARAPAAAARAVLRAAQSHDGRVRLCSLRGLTARRRPHVQARRRGATPASRTPYFLVPEQQRARATTGRGSRTGCARSGSRWTSSGVSRPVPLFEPPLDPMALVQRPRPRGGVDAARRSPRRRRRRRTTASRSCSAGPRNWWTGCSQLGDDLLGVLERRDAEELSLLQSRQEGVILGADPGDQGGPGRERAERTSPSCERQAAAGDRQRPLPEAARPTGSARWSRPRSA